MRKLDDINLEKIPPRKLQTGCMAFVGIILFFVLVLGILVDGPLRGYVVFYLSVTAALFLGVSIRQPMNRTAKYLLLTGGAMCAWMLLLQVSDYRHFSPTAYYGARFIYSAFLCEYLMLLPCAALLDEGENPRALKILCGCCIAGGAALCMLAGLLYLDHLPVLFQRFTGWVGGRLGVNWHPNLLARVLMVGFGLSTALIFLQKKWWAKLLLGILAAIQFVVMAMTNARTVIAPACCILGGLVFFRIYREKDRKNTVIRFLAGLLAAAVILLLSYKVSDWISEQQYQYLKSRNTETEEEITPVVSPREFSSGLLSFNGRTDIWSAAFRAIGEEPEVLLTGTPDPGALISRYYGGLGDEFYYQSGVAHAHNAWLELLLRTGLPGFLIALWITWLALRSIFRLMFLRRSDMFRKTVGMVVLAILIAEFFEPNLFYSEIPLSAVNLVFMTLTGYLVYWADRAEKLPLGKAASRPQ